MDHFRHLIIVNSKLTACDELLPENVDLLDKLSPPWPSGLKRRNPTLVPAVRARFEPRCERPHFAPTCNGVRVCGRNRTEAREREWAEGTVSTVQPTGHVQLSDEILP